MEIFKLLLHFNPEMNITESTIISEQNFVVQQFKTASISQYSYYIESDKSAIIIDPIRDTEIYEKFLEKRGSNLKYIIETHIHADFIGGHLELSKKLGSEIIYGPNAGTKFPTRTVNDGDVLNLGKIKLKILTTPGHTLESISILLVDDKNKERAIFTGDCLFLGEVGRPDLSVDSNYKANDMAGIMYDSLQKLKRSIPDDVIIFPAHGAGSHCGTNIQSGDSDTFGNQKKKNYALANITKDEFINKVTANIDQPPAYYFHDVKLNKSTPTSLSSLIKNSFIPFNSEKFLKFLDEDVVILDTRDFNEALNSFVKGSYLLTLKMPFEVYVGTLFSPDQKYVFISEKGKELEVIKRLALVGFENILGYLQDDMNNFIVYCKQAGRSDALTSAYIVSPLEVKHVVEGRKIDLLDVREKSEWISTGVVPNSHLLPLKDLEKNISSLIGEHKKNKEWGVFCKTGGRSACAVSIMKKYDIQNISFLRGVEFLKENNVELVPYVVK